MPTVRGCNLPEDLHYFIEKHIWAKPVADNRVRVGMTSVAANLSGGSLTAVTVKSKKIGKEISKGKSLATVESSKFVGPVPAPVTGTLVAVNDKVTADPNLAINDPYGEGWIAEMEPNDWEADKAELATGSDGVAAYQQAMEAEDLSCE